MKRQIMSASAAALFAVGVGTSAGCGYVKQETLDVKVAAAVESAIDARIDSEVNRVIAENDHRLVNDLESMLGSVHCIKTSVDYRRVGPDIPPVVTTVEGSGTGLAFAYHDEHTYIITSAHVVQNETVQVVTMPKGEEGDFDVSIYVLMAERSVIADSVDDADPSDDVPLELVEVDDENDIAILRTPKKLPLSSAYVLDPDVDPRVGDDVFMIGFPQGILKTTARGMFTKRDHQFSDGDVLDVLDIDATAGNSGSPYFVKKGNTLYWAGVTGMMLPEANDSELYALGHPMAKVYDIIKDYLPIDGKKR